MATNDLIRLPVPAGAAGIAALVEPLSRALAGRGPAIAPVPVVGPTISEQYVRSILAAVQVEQPLEDDQTAVVMATSGSTGNPSGVRLSAANLSALRPFDHQPCAWVAAIPLTSVGGLNVLVRALSTGAHLEGVDSLGGAGPFTVAGFADAVQRAGLHASLIRTSIVPAQLARLLDDDQGRDALRGCTTVLVGGAALDPALAQRAQELDIAITTTYGMTETSGGCVYNNQPLPSVTITIGDDGAVVINGPMVALGYRCDPDRTAAHFGPDGFVTSDLGRMESGRLRILGRRDDIVTVNGVNVSVDAVRAQIASMPAITTAAVLPRADSRAGAHLFAFVVTDDGLPADLDQVNQLLVHALGTPARIRTVITLSSLPMLPNGKVDRQQLAHLIAEDR